MDSIPSQQKCKLGSLRSVLYRVCMVQIGAWFALFWLLLTECVLVEWCARGFLFSNTQPFAVCVVDREWGGSMERT